MTTVVEHTTESNLDAEQLVGLLTAPVNPAVGRQLCVAFSHVLFRNRLRQDRPQGLRTYPAAVPLAGRSDQPYHQ